MVLIDLSPDGGTTPEKVPGSTILPAQPKLASKISPDELFQTSIPVPPKMDKVDPKKPLVDYIPAFGIICSLISVLCFSFNSVIVKLLKHHYGIPAIEVLVVRSTFQFTICGLIILFKRYSLRSKKDSNYILCCRAITGTLSLSCIFTAFNLIPIGDATTIYFSSPVMVTIIAYFYLKEPFRCVQSVTCILTVLGITFIVQPEMIFGHKEYVHYPYMTLGLLMAITAAITSSITLVNLRKLKATPAAVVVFWFSTAVLVFGIIIVQTLDLYVPINFDDPLCCGLLVIIGLMSVCEQYFLTVALQHEDATTISVTRSFNIVLAFLWEVVIFDEIVTWPSIVGGVLVTCCILILALSKSFQIFFTKICTCTQQTMDSEQADNVEKKANYIQTVSNNC